MWQRIALIAAVLMTTAACADEPGAGRPQPSATGVASPQPNQSPNPSVPPPRPLPLPTSPQELQPEDTAQNAALAAEHFVALMNYAHSTGDVGPLQEISAPTCTPCHTFIADVEDLYGDGGYAVGNVVSLGDPASSRVEDGAWHITVDWNLSDGVRVPADGETILLEPITLPEQRIAVELREGAWVYLNFDGPSD